MHSGRCSAIRVSIARAGPFDPKRTRGSWACPWWSWMKLYTYSTAGVRGGGTWGAHGSECSSGSRTTRQEAREMNKLGSPSAYSDGYQSSESPPICLVQDSRTSLGTAVFCRSMRQPARYSFLRHGIPALLTQAPAVSRQPARALEHAVRPTSSSPAFSPPRNDEGRAAEFRMRSHSRSNGAPTLLIVLEPAEARVVRDDVAL